MGMLFNTPATVKLLQILNDRYGPVDPNDPTKGVKNRGDVSFYTGKSAGNNYNCAKITDVWNALKLSTGSAASDRNWIKWLTAIEAHQHGGTTSAWALREAIGVFLQDKFCTAIEFFAVPSSQIIVYFPTKVLHVKNTKYHSAIITVETVTFDKV